MIKRKKNQKGFSIVESIIGIAIVASVFVTFLALLPRVFETEKQALRIVVATNLAQEGIEMIRSLRDNNLKENRNSFYPYFPSEAGDPNVCWYPNNRIYPAYY